MNNKSDARSKNATLSASLSTFKRCTKEAVAARLKDFRASARLTQQQMADGANSMALPSYKDYEAGNRMPGGEALDGLAMHGMNINWLLTGEGSMFLSGSGSMAGEPGQVGYGAALPPVDSVLLQGVIDFFYAWLDEHKDFVRIDRDRHGAIIAVLYRVAAQSGEVKKPELMQVLGLAA